jgi:hypothetical protein
MSEPTYSCSNAHPLLDHLVGGGQQRFRDGEAERLGEWATSLIERPSCQALAMGVHHHAQAGRCDRYSLPAPDRPETFRPLLLPSWRLNFGKTLQNNSATPRFPGPAVACVSSCACGRIDWRLEAVIGPNLHETGASPLRVFEHGSRHAVCGAGGTAGPAPTWG